MTEQRNLSAGPSQLPTRGKRQRWWLCGTVIALSAVSFAAWLLRVPGRPFDRELWNDFDSMAKKNVPRLEMADRFVADGSLRGKTRDEVVAMLGEPPEPAYFKNWDLVYCLGQERAFFAIDSEWLIFRLDAQGRVADYRIVHD